MTNRLIIHLPEVSHVYDSDDLAKLDTLARFCKEELGAHHSSENIEELTIDTLSPEMSDKYHSLLLKLGLH